MNRRDFLVNSAESVALYSFYHFVSSSLAWAKPLKPVIEKWIIEIGEISSSVQKDKLKPIEWQKAIERLHSKVPFEELVKFVDLERALKQVRYPQQKLGAIENVKWPVVEGFPKDLNFGHKLFIYRKGSCTPPHAHNNLVSAHLVVKGEIRVRTFDRIKDLDNAILVKPTRDQIAKPGITVSMSDYQDNVHWFDGVSDISVSFDVPIPGIEITKQYKHQAAAYNQISLDPSVAPRSDGLIEAQIISFNESVKRFASV